jgi:hypothetical protein
MSSLSRTCGCITQSGTECKNKVSSGERYCHIHNSMNNRRSQVRSASPRAGARAVSPRKRSQGRSPRLSPKLLSPKLSPSQEEVNKNNRNHLLESLLSFFSGEEKGYFPGVVSLIDEYKNDKYEYYKVAFDNDVTIVLRAVEGFEEILFLLNIDNGLIENLSNSVVIKKILKEKLGNKFFNNGRYARVRVKYEKITPSEFYNTKGVPKVDIDYDDIVGSYGREIDDYKDCVSNEEKDQIRRAEIAIETKDYGEFKKIYRNLNYCQLYEIYNKIDPTDLNIARILFMPYRGDILNIDDMNLGRWIKSVAENAILKNDIKLLEMLIKTLEPYNVINKILIEGYLNLAKSTDNQEIILYLEEDLQRRKLDLTYMVKWIEDDTKKKRRK